LDSRSGAGPYVLITTIRGRLGWSGSSASSCCAATRRSRRLFNAIVSFLLIGAAIFFLVVKPVNALMARRKAGSEPEPAAVPEDIVLLGEIRDLLRTR
jgi:large-conductance mechanosensitive channel